MFIRTESFREFIRFYPIVSLIISINIIIYLLSILPFFPNIWFFETFSGVNLYITEGQFWRLLTPIFMHSGFSHMLFNSFSILLFGPALERMLGSGRFLFVYLFSGIIANIATLMVEPLTFTHVGSSGAIFGLFGYYLSIIMFRKTMLSRQNSQIIITLLVINLLMTFLQPNINITAHLFGLLGGFLLGAFPYFNKKDFSDSIKGVSNWAGSKKKDFSYQSPLKKLMWGVIVLLAILGFLAQR
ncbi:rhomboid family intramembrane serine protease [Neobacillus massiliamazoniensis]|jgi:membrane associated rhomboid family serine protease|uniref:Sporulation membrane protein and putative endopeptidase YdcA n=1 Tax=Neobacillus massiliamazoniensis TaxID=1499688 RepID=A0A0U1P4F6_9BACI|nr:rhomboid family intramembrane serine protease [Neobacillus massiliamazoniensis]CRK85130.1 sporulation membrane protein and putative endopeptidase YdcA [Neobacillus massiliamazoniensis]